MQANVYYYVEAAFHAYIKTQTLQYLYNTKRTKTRMWADAQRDGHPAEYRWRPLFNAAVWLTPTTRMQCSNAAKTRNPLKLGGVPQTTGPISAASRPKCTTLLLNEFFSIVDTRLNCEDIARRSCAMVPRRRFLASFCVLYFQQAACSKFQTCILNSH